MWQGLIILENDSKCVKSKSDVAFYIIASSWHTDGLLYFALSMPLYVCNFFSPLVTQTFCSGRKINSSQTLYLLKQTKTYELHRWAPIAVCPAKFTVVFSRKLLKALWLTEECVSIHSRFAKNILLYELKRCDWSKSAWTHTLVFRILYFYMHCGASRYSRELLRLFEGKYWGTCSNTIRARKHK